MSSVRQSTDLRVTFLTVLFALSLFPACAESLTWAAVTREYTAKVGETQAEVTFAFTNQSPNGALIRQVSPSCGCVTARLPNLPWHIAPGTAGQIKATINFAGKHGVVTKALLVETSDGPKSLLITVTIPELETALAERERNRQMATVDCQAVFKGACGKCHSEPTKGKMGLALYETACGICHNAEHRSSMVPNLQVLNHPVDAIYWRQWVTAGKPNSLMPAFAKPAGGPLNENQITSLVEYLNRNLSSEATLKSNRKE